jgi:hypothetical protein
MFVDLTLSLSKKSPFFKNVSEEEKTRLLFSGHVGTHLDTFFHNPIPLEWIDRTGVLLDLRSFGPEIGAETLDGFEFGKGISFIGLDTAGLRRGEEHIRADPILRRARNLRELDRNPCQDCRRNSRSQDLSAPAAADM